jgi:hypothetical protein
MLAAAVVVLIPQHHLVVLAAVEIRALRLLETELLALLIWAVAVEVVLVVVLVVMEALAAPALSSCPTPCQKAQQLNSCLLQHGQHQQASQPLITW